MLYRDDLYQRIRIAQMLKLQPRIPHCACAPTKRTATLPLHQGTPELHRALSYPSSRSRAVEDNFSYKRGLGEIIVLPAKPAAYRQAVQISNRPDDPGPMPKADILLVCGLPRRQIIPERSPASDLDRETN